MADVTLAAQAEEDAPLDYPIPGAAELILKLLTADYDGTGAAGGFVPCVQITLASGVIAGTFPLGQTIAAGASADVSWFPNGGLKTAAPNAFGSSLLGAQADGTTAALTAVQTAVTWDHPPDVIIGTDIALNGSADGFVINTPGWYSVMFSWHLTGLDVTSKGQAQMYLATSNSPEEGWFGPLGSLQEDTAEINGAIDTNDQYGVITVPPVNFQAFTAGLNVSGVGIISPGYTGTAPMLGPNCTLVVVREA